MHIHVSAPPSMLFPSLWMERGWSSTKYNSLHLTSMLHPGLGDWSSHGETCGCPYGALVERADRDRRVDRVAPNESSVAHLRAELWPETCFCPYGAPVERADRDRCVDRVAPNESFAVQMRAELWPETCFCPYGAPVERADRHRRVDRVAPNESSVAQLRAELLPETCFCLDVHPKPQGRIHGFCGASDDHPCMH